VGGSHCAATHIVYKLFADWIGKKSTMSLLNCDNCSRTDRKKVLEMSLSNGGTCSRTASEKSRRCRC